ncbi:MAG: hypothetical protein GF353_29945 [Candidatus Lokiarchaeota archaeon]|nr:hypothetical protein [Candidatus Lokiarchaeota archaeon]
MKKGEILAELKKAIYEVQDLSGEKYFEINEHTIPIGNLPGFDSFRVLETLFIVSTALGLEIEDDINLFISPDENRALQLHEISDRIYKQIK